MKIKVILSTAVVAIAGVAWLGRGWYDTRQGLVTLQVSEVPIADVLARLSRQTGRLFVADKTLEGKVTVDLKRVPLDEALDQVMQQAGGSWSVWHAIHGTGGGLARLETALRDRASVESAGWTNLAPAFEPPPGLADLEKLVPGGAGDGGPEAGGRRMIVEDSGPVVIRRGGDGAGGGARVVIRRGDGPLTGEPGGTRDVDVQVGPGTREVKIGSAPGGGPGSGSANQVRIVTVSRDGSGKMTQESWSPEVVCMEKSLMSKLGEYSPLTTSLEAALAAASKVQGQVTSLYVFKRMPGGFSLPPEVMAVRRKGGVAPTITTSDGKGAMSHGDAMPPLESVEALVNRTRAENFTKLTPEQRVRQAQERQGAKTNQQDNP